MNILNYFQIVKAYVMDDANYYVIIMTSVHEEIALLQSRLARTTVTLACALIAAALIYSLAPAPRQQVSYNTIQIHTSHLVEANQSFVKRVEASNPPAIPMKGPPAIQLFNYALASNGARASGGQHPDYLIDGNSTQYDLGKGFAQAYWKYSPPQIFQVDLKAPTTISCIRFLLWDLEKARFYRYKLEICADELGKEWTLAADKTSKEMECRSWQVIHITPTPVKSIRLTGTHNSANGGFQVVELQAFYEINGMRFEEPKEEVTKPANATGSSPTPAENLEF